MFASALMAVVSAAASGSRFVPAFVVAVEFFHFVEFAVFNQRDKFFETLRPFDPKQGISGGVSGASRAAVWSCHAIQ